VAIAFVVPARGEATRRTIVTQLPLSFEAYRKDYPSIPERRDRRSATARPSKAAFVKGPLERLGVKGTSPPLEGLGRQLHSMAH